jgi:hypothetical protein
MESKLLSETHTRGNEMSKFEKAAKYVEVCRDTLEGLVNDPSEKPLYGTELDAALRLAVEAARIVRLLTEYTSATLHSENFDTEIQEAVILINDQCEEYLDAMES